MFSSSFKPERHPTDPGSQEPTEGFDRSVRLHPLPHSPSTARLTSSLRNAAPAARDEDQGLHCAQIPPPRRGLHLTSNVRSGVEVRAGSPRRGGLMDRCTATVCHMGCGQEGVCVGSTLTLLSPAPPSSPERGLGLLRAVVSEGSRI